MRVLDLFCGAGGAAIGLHQAWPDAEIVGVDIKPQPRYPFKLIVGDALSVLRDVIEKIGVFGALSPDFIWASPPCQHYSTAALSHRMNGTVYSDLVAATRELLAVSGVPWVMENVPKAPMRKDLMLCGSHFSLKVVRHRIFEFFDARTILMPPCKHPLDVITVCGHGTPAWVMKQRAARGFVPNPPIAEKRDAMGIHWMNRGELAQAIPPAYSKYIAEQFLASRAAAEREGTD